MHPVRVLPILAALALAACGNMQRLSEVGSNPTMSPPSDPTKAKGYQPLTLPMPHLVEAPAEANSLWRSGSRAFFKDQRAANVGDLVTVLVNTTDAADVENATQATRSATESMGVPNLFGLENILPHSGMTPGALVTTNSSNGNNGAGVLKRNETVTLRLAGVITQVLGNGNLVVSARQEMRVNGELRELAVSGVIRPQDIASDNTISHDRMAEARIVYGGRGTLTDVQSPRYGQEVLDQVMPF